jgi:GDP-L-fucose synthase
MTDNVLVTGGGGFLGSHLVDRLEAAGVEPFVARRQEYDLIRQDDTSRLFADARPDLVFHLAAEVGGIGANQANPGRFWYANVAIGSNVLEESRKAGVKKVVLLGTVAKARSRSAPPNEGGSRKPVNSGRPGLA